MDNFNLTEKEKAILLKIARKSIDDAFNNNGNEFINSPELSSELTDGLKKNAGVFVTLKIKGEQLRGCIGNFVSAVPLYINVYKMAKEAAFSDPRFNPLSSAEFREIKIEISVLSPLEKIEKFDDIEIGRHGLYIIKGMHHGVLLPQVATEFKMDRKGFLEAVSTKAGLPPDAYKNGADILTFTALVFGE